MRTEIFRCGVSTRYARVQIGDSEEMKAIIILMVLLGLLMFGLIVATATPNDQEEYEKYMRYKERKRRHEID